jgi:predicted phosphodiesterase
MGKTFVIIGDTHFPFTNLNTLYGKGGVIDTIKKIKPDYVVQMGDLYDMYSFSKFPYKRDVMTPRQELEAGRKMAEEMWAKVKKAAGPWKCKCIQLKGNHDERPAKRLLENLPELFPVMSDPMHELFVFKGVCTQQAERDGFVLDGIMFMHGFRSKLGDHASHNHMPTVTGHSHRGGVVYLRKGNETIWELNAGFCADEFSVPLSYTRQRTISTWTQGFGIIDSMGPRFVSMPNVP